MAEPKSHPTVRVGWLQLLNEKAPLSELSTALPPAKSIPK